MSTGFNLTTILTRLCGPTGVLLLMVGSCQVVQAAPLLPPGDETPVLRLEAGGPQSYVSGLAFSSDGQQLYAAGWDKAIQVWNRQQDGTFVFSPAMSLRIPIGPGLAGGLNSLAQSSDGQWLAVAGSGYSRDMAGLRRLGWILPAAVLGRQGQLDEGLIYVFHVPTRAVTLLSGHRGPVQALDFVRGSAMNPPPLVSIGEERGAGQQTQTQTQLRLRFWDVKAGAELTNLHTFPAATGWAPIPPLNGWRPGMTAWSTGGEPHQARVALGWGDNQFRIWDVDARKMKSALTGDNTVLVLPLPGGDTRLLVGGHGELGVWTVPPANEELDKARHFTPVAGSSIHGTARQLPKAAAFLPGKDSKSSHVAIMAGTFGQGALAKYRLVILNASGALPTVRELPLPWPATDRQPVIAASADGRLLALAGNDDSAIELYRVADLLAGNLKPLQKLRSQGLLVREATFVQREAGWGIRFQGAPGSSSAEARVLDVANRRIVSDAADWRSATFNPQGWTVKYPTPQSNVLTVQRTGGKPVPLPLEEGQVVTKAEVGPAPPGMDVPVVAVASHGRGQPLLQIFNAQTGEPLRWCTGHTERIRTLKFSSDGRMLLSAGDDRMVCAWSLADLAERNFGQHGRLPDVVIGRPNQRLVVQASRADSPLKVGDIITGIMQNRELIAPQAPLEFYELILQQQPGNKVQVQVERNKRPELLTVTVGQAIDEARPLFSLFVMPPAKKPVPAAPAGEVEAWSWIGWHWLGHFDSSDENVERLLGWHFNTGAAEQPAEYAPIGEYRDGFYRRGLLESLINEQTLTMPVTEEEPRISAWLRRLDNGEPVPVDYDDQFELRTREIEAVVELTHVSPQNIEALGLQPELALDGEKLTLKRISPHKWSVDLSQRALTRGLHRLAVTLTTPQRQSTFIERLHYQPPAPVIEMEQTPETKLPTGTVAAKVVPAGENLHVEFLRSGEDKPLAVWDADKTLEIKQEVELVPGDNEFVIRSWDPTVPAEYRAAETSQVVVNLRRAVPAEAPQITILKVSRDAEADSLAMEQVDGVYHTSHPKAIIAGTITGMEKLTSATIKVGEKSVALANFEPDSGAKFEMLQPLMLQPGLQTVVIEAGLGEQKSPQRLKFSYEPPLPRIASIIIKPKEKQPLPEGIKPEPNVFYDEFSEQDAEVIASLMDGQDADYKVSLWIDETQAPDQLAMVDKNADAHILRGRLTLPKGRSRIAVLLESKWGASPVKSSVEVDFLSPPVILAIDAPKELVSQTLHFKCRIRSALDVRSAFLRIDNMESPEAYAVQRVAGTPDLWELDLPEVGLSEGNHLLRVTAANADGMSLVPVEHHVKVMKPADKPPILALLDSQGNEIIDEQAVITDVSRQQLKFSVKSDSPVQTRLLVKSPLEAGREGYVPIEQKLKVAHLDGLPQVAQVELSEGTSQVTLEVTNKGGMTARHVLFSYVPPPVKVEILHMTVNGINLAPPPPHGGASHVEGMCRFDNPAPAADVVLHGKVIVRKGTLDHLAARIWLNSYKLPGIDVNPQTGEFQAKLDFNRRHGNLIKVEVYRHDGHAAVEVGATKTVSIDCTKPAEGQQLYLLLLGDGQGDVQGELLKERARKFLGASPFGKQVGTSDTWKSNNFSQIHVYKAVNVAKPVVMRQVHQLVKMMNDNLKASGGPRSLLMIYYQGEIVLKKDDFELGSPNSTSKNRLSGRTLEDQLMQTHGAHLIFLDLRNEKGLVASDVWPKAPHLGLVIANWKGAKEKPEDVELISALEQFLPQTRVVRELAESIKGSYQKAARTYPDQVESIEQLENLYDIRLGQAMDE